MLTILFSGLFQFVTVSYATNLGMDLCGMTNLDADPVNFPEDSDSDEQLRWLHNLATIMICLVWKEHSASDLRIVSYSGDHPGAYAGRRDRGTLPYVYCKCGEGIFPFFC